jgi:hypothetical protein
VSWRLALEKRPDPSGWLPYVLPGLAIVIGLLLGAILLSVMGTHTLERLTKKWLEAPLAVSIACPRRW